MAAAFLVSPWVGANLSSRSFEIKRAHGSTYRLYCAKYGKGGSGFGWYGSLRCPPERPGSTLDVDMIWMKGLDRSVKHIYVTMGEKEVLVDHVVKLTHLIKRSNPDIDVKLDASPTEAHDQIMLEAWLGTVGFATLRMKDWFKSRLYT